MHSFRNVLYDELFFRFYYIIHLKIDAYILIIYTLLVYRIYIYIYIYIFIITHTF